jgi:hypothetical protein
MNNKFPNGKDFMHTVIPFYKMYRNAALKMDLLLLKLCLYSKKKDITTGCTSCFISDAANIFSSKQILFLFSSYKNTNYYFKIKLSMLF